MKTGTLLITGLLLFLCLFPAVANEKKNNKNKQKPCYIILDFKILTERDGHRKAIASKIKVIEGSEATIQLDGSSNLPDNKKSESSFQTTGTMDKENSKPFISSISVLPHVLDGSSPRRIQLNMSLKLGHTRHRFRSQKITTVLLEGEPLEMKWENHDKSKVDSLHLTAAISKEN